MARRGRGEGSIFQLKDGSWRGFVTLGYDDSGRQLKLWRRGKTRRLVAEKLNQIAAKSGTRLVHQPERVTLVEWLMRFYELRSREVRPRTLENYRHYLSKIEPALGRVELQRLRPLHIRGFYARLADAGLSPSVRIHIHHFLKSAFRDAVREEVVERNPVDAVDAPKNRHVTTPKVWEPAQVEAFLVAARGDRLCVLFHLLLGTGARIGEVLALRWQDVHDDRLTISRTLGTVNNRPIFGPPKTPRGNREVYLADDLRVLMSGQREDQRFEREQASQWEDNDLVFCTRTGRPLSPHNVRRTFKRLCLKAKVPQIRIHDLRHTYITLARDLGKDAEVVAQRVGQDVRVTLTVYSKVTEARQKKAAATLEELVHG